MLKGKGWISSTNNCFMPSAEGEQGKNINFPLIFLRTCTAECAPLMVKLNYCQGGVSQLISFSDMMTNFSGTSCKNKIAVNKICVCVPFPRAMKRASLLSSEYLGHYSAYWHSIRVSNLTLHLSRILTKITARHQQLKKARHRSSSKMQRKVRRPSTALAPAFLPCVAHILVDFMVAEY